VRNILQTQTPRPTKSATRKKIKFSSALLQPSHLN